MFKTENKFIYRIQINDTVESICLKFNTSKEKIIRNNANILLYEGEIIEIEVNNYILHFVKPTETINKIADIYKIDIDKIKTTNNLNSDRLFIGQMIKICL